MRLFGSELIFNFLNYKSNNSTRPQQSKTTIYIYIAQKAFLYNRFAYKKYTIIIIPQNN